MEDIEMYFDKNVAKVFSALEQNEKNFKVADCIDQVIMSIMWTGHKKMHITELWGWSHTDRYHSMFWYIQDTESSIDWVDISPYMIQLAIDYCYPAHVSRLPFIRFIVDDILHYLVKQKNNSIDLAIMKYTIDHIQDLDRLFLLLSEKLQKNWYLVSSIWFLDPLLHSRSTNARFLYQWKEFPLDESRMLKEWEWFGVKFFNTSWDIESWYMPWAHTTKYYHSKEKILSLSEKYWFEYYLWDWKGYISSDSTFGQEILVLRKL